MEEGSASGIMGRANQRFTGEHGFGIIRGGGGGRGSGPGPVRGSPESTGSGLLGEAAEAAAVEKAVLRVLWAGPFRGSPESTGSGLLGAAEAAGRGRGKEARAASCR